MKRKPSPIKTPKKAQKAPLKRKYTNAHPLKKKAESRPSRVKSTITKPTPWTAKGDPDGDPNITLGDGRKVVLQPAKQEPIPEDNPLFDPNYIPIDGPDRRERRKLIANWLKGKESGLLRYDIAIALKRQEENIERHSYVLAALRSIYGARADWRVSLCIHAWLYPQEKEELQWWLTKAAMEGNTKELEAFARATLLIRRAENRDEGGMFRPAQFHALLFVIECQRSGRMPKQNEVRAHLIKKNISIPSRNNESTHLFCGPVLRNLQRGKGGRPRK
jgi:hypothetical protein